MQYIIFWIKSHTRLIISVVLIAGVVGAYFVTRGNNETTSFAYTAVETVERGMVSSGIYTTGEVVAAQKLDLDVYKQLSRIDVVNVTNGGHVEKGDVLVSFDKSDAFVDAESTRVSLAEAELALNTERENATDANTAIRTLENKVASYKKEIVDIDADISDAYLDFLNEDLEVEAHPDDESRLLGETRPTLSGRYVSTEEGMYTIDIYSSGSQSGYSFRVTGLETDTDSVIFSNAVDIGTRGLKVTFPSTIHGGDTWIIRVPNTDIATYQKTKEDYERSVADFKEERVTALVNLENAEQDLEDLRATDGSSYRNLGVEKAETSVSATRQRLSEQYDVIQERDIVAPFSGTIQDMENVVEGATPTGGSEDTINLGTLISDEFLTTFTLSATDVAKVMLGQKVKVTITSFNDKPVFEASITEISSLPSSEGVAQYEVNAKIIYDKNSTSVVLREGVLADIEIVEEEHTDVLRVPTSAVSYMEGQAAVYVIDTLTDTQKKQVAKMGIVRTDVAPVESYPVTVTLGLEGAYYVEIIDGITEGAYVVTTKTVPTATASVVNQEGHVPGSGMRTSESSVERKPE